MINYKFFFEIGITWLGKKVDKISIGQLAQKTWF